MALHMAYVLDHVLDRGEKRAQAAVARHSIIRYLAVILVLGVLMITEVGNPIAAFVGIIGLKVSAYIQPLFCKAVPQERKKLNKE